MMKETIKPPENLSSPKPGAGGGLSLAVAGKIFLRVEKAIIGEKKIGVFFGKSMPAFDEGTKNAVWRLTIADADVNPFAGVHENGADFDVAKFKSRLTNIHMEYDGELHFDINGSKNGQVRQAIEEAVLAYKSESESILAASTVPQKRANPVETA